MPFISLVNYWNYLNYIQDEPSAWRTRLRGIITCLRQLIRPDYDLYVWIGNYCHKQPQNQYCKQNIQIRTSLKIQFLLVDAGHTFIKCSKRIMYTRTNWPYVELELWVHSHWKLLVYLKFRERSSGCLKWGITSQYVDNIKLYFPVLIW